MYDVGEMKKVIDDALQVANEKVRSQFETAFRKIYVGNKVPDIFSKNLKISKYELKTIKDLESVLAGSGFYIIFTDLDIGKNDCTLSLAPNLVAIYRGECNTVKKRVQSHLFNNDYRTCFDRRKADYLAKLQNSGKLFHEQLWPASLKIGNGESGINIDQQFTENKWYVVVHNMIGSSQKVRIQAERAFDAVFERPVASREKT